MDCCLSSRNKKPKIEIIDKIPDGQDFDYLRPEGRTIYSIDKIYDVPKVEIDFDGWYMNSVCLRPESKKIRPHFLLLQRTPPVSPQVSSESSGSDTIF